MCDTCGCDGSGECARSGGRSCEHGRRQEHGHGHGHVQGQGQGQGSEAGLPLPILRENDRAAHRVRDRLREHGVHAMSILGTPGAGKTALLERTLAGLPIAAGVIVADLRTTSDARRLEREGVPVVALATGTGCHITAPMVERALDALPLADLDVLYIENVGNLVCPALFDIGEEARAVVLSVAEGTDKPEKYPVIFQDASCLVINKIDLLPYVDFDIRRSAALVRRLQPGIEVFPLSARTGEGVEPWLRWVEGRTRAKAR